MMALRRLGSGWIRPSPELAGGRYSRDLDWHLDVMLALMRTLPMLLVRLSRDEELKIARRRKYVRRERIRQLISLIVFLAERLIRKALESWVSVSFMRAYLDSSRGCRLLPSFMPRYL